MSVDPIRTAAMVDALKLIGGGDTTWHHKAYPRKYVRLRLQERVRFRPLGQDDWHRGHTLDMGRGGCFVVTYDVLEAGTDVELEFVDLENAPFATEARVEWVRDWEKAKGHLPGMGMTFVSGQLHDSIPAALTARLADFVSQLRHAGRLQTSLTAAIPPPS